MKAKKGSENKILLNKKDFKQVKKVAVRNANITPKLKAALERSGKFSNALKKINKQYGNALTNLASERNVEVLKFFRHDIDQSLKSKIESIADELHKILNKPGILSAIKSKNKPGNSSQDIQGCFLSEVLKIGFKPEAKGLFKNGNNQLLRPDYYLLVDKTGIILEVERGKVTINNMDLLDFWKCHLCEHANFLFLLVPKELRQNDEMRPRKEFKTVSNRLGSFFKPDSYTNVWGLCVFGY